MTIHWQTNAAPEASKPRATPLRTGDVATQLLIAETSATATLAAGTAYELEGPTHRLVVRLRALLESRSPRAVDRDALEHALDAAEQIETTVRGLHAFTSTPNATVGVDVHEALELALHLAMPDLASRAQISRSYAPVERVRGHVGRLTLALLGLLRNAAASVPAGMPAANTVFVRTGRSAGRVTIEVVDTGVGIEPADLEYVFDPFFTSKPLPGSVGLGLAVARAAIQEMGGTIEVESAVGHGSRFRISLEPMEASDLTVLSCIHCDASPGRRVLCVARSATDAQQLGELIDEGDTRIVFATVEDALLRLTTGELYDLVLCERGASLEGEFRERLSRLAPESVPRTFTVPLPVSRS